MSNSPGNKTLPATTGIMDTKRATHSASVGPFSTGTEGERKLNINQCTTSIFHQLIYLCTRFHLSLNLYLL